MIRYIPCFFLSIFILASCKNDETATESDADYCDCEMLALDNLYNHFYLEDRSVPYTGVCKLFHKNGQLKQERELVDGKNNGYYRVYSESGVLLEEGSFLNNRHHGVFKYFDESGNLIVEAEYENGVRKAGNEIIE
jgi:antitoxin component YwqK of YwqJK toxin-antitoxin module